MKKLFLFSIVVLLCNSCKEEEFKAPIDNQKFYEYHESKNWTATSFKNEMLGEWQFIYSYCCFEATAASWSDTREENYILKIEKDVIQVFKDEQLQKSLTWTLEARGEDAFYLESEDFIENTFGTIYFYEDYMLFNGSPSDGSDNYFEKIE